MANDVAQVTGVTGFTYGGNRPGRVFEMHPADAAAAVKAGGAVASLAGVTRRAIGYACACGFRPVVRSCSRCGGDAVRE